MKSIIHKFKLGDGECDIFMNTAECDWDHGDCLSANDSFDIKAYNVDCGVHKALTCGQCVFAPGGQIDPDLCGGDCEWDEDNYCRGANGGVRCKQLISKGHTDIFADYSESFFKALEDRKKMSKGSKERDLYFVYGRVEKSPTCGSCVYVSHHCSCKSSLFILQLLYTFSFKFLFV